MRRYLVLAIAVITLFVNTYEVFAAPPVDSAIESSKIDAEKSLIDQLDASQVSSKKKKYRVGLSYVNGYPLIAFEDIGDRGFGWAILERFAEANNIEFEYTAMPITRLQPSMDSGAIDFIFPDNPRWSLYRSNRVPNIFSGPVMSAISVTFVRQENHGMVLENVKKIAIPFGYSANTWIDPIQKHNIKTMPVRDLNTALYSVVQRTADAADVEYNIGQSLISQNSSLAYLTIAPKLPNRHVDYHLSSIKHIVLLEKLTTFIKQEHILIEKLRKKYGIKYHHEILKNPQIPE